MVLRFVIGTAEFLRHMPVKGRPRKLSGRLRDLGPVFMEEGCHGQKGHTAKGIKLTKKTVEEDSASYKRWIR